MSGVRCQVSGVGCRMSDVGCRVSGVGCRVSGVRWVAWPTAQCVLEDMRLRPGLAWPFPAVSNGLPLAGGSCRWCGLDDGDLMVVTQYRLLLVSLRVLVDKYTPAADREWSSMVSRIRRARGQNGVQGPGTSGPFPPHSGPSHLLPYSRPLKGLGGLDRPPTAVTRPMVSPASAVPFEWVSEGGVEAAVVGRVVDGQARRATVGGAAAAGGICGWWAALGADSAHRGFTVLVCLGVIEGYRFDVA